MFAQEYIKMLFKRDSPSAFFLLRHLYQDKQKAQILHDIITKFDEDLETYGYFKSFENDNYEYKEPPTRFIAVRSCLAQSYCRLLDFKQALKVIDDAIAHTPTYSDLYAIKSNIYMVCIICYCSLKTNYQITKTKVFREYSGVNGGYSDS